MTDWTARPVKIPLGFLGAGSFVAELYEDGADADAHPRDATIWRQHVTAQTVLTARLAQGGGLAAIFRKQ
jgi:alpha-glucosidase